MTIEGGKLAFDKLEKDEQVPYDLLLLADPSKELVETYVQSADLYVARRNDELLGIIVLFPVTIEQVEIKNVAVRTALQGQGIGSFLIEQAVQAARLDGYARICIGTANSSIGQLHLYQKLGFEIAAVKWNFFTDNYAEPIIENGIRAKHMIMLERPLDALPENGHNEWITP